MITDKTHNGRWSEHRPIQEKGEINMAIIRIKGSGLYVGTVRAAGLNVARIEAAGFTVEIK